jgi:hypothetical protein
MPIVNKHARTAIVSKYLPPTNYHGSRIKVTGRNHTRIYPYDTYAGNGDSTQAHLSALERFLLDFGLSEASYAAYHTEYGMGLAELC